MVPFSDLFKEISFTIQIEFKGSPFNYSISDCPIEMNFGTILDYKTNKYDSSIPITFLTKSSTTTVQSISTLFPFDEITDKSNLYLTSVMVNHVHNNFPMAIGICFKDDSKIETPEMKIGYNMTILANSTTTNKCFADERVLANKPDFIKSYCGCNNMDELTAGLEYKIVDMKESEKMSNRDPELALQFLSLDEFNDTKNGPSKYVFVKMDQTLSDHKLLKEIEKLPRGPFINYKKVESSGNNMSDEVDKSGIETRLIDEFQNPLVVGIEEFSIPFDRFKDYIDTKWEIVSMYNKSASLRDFKISIHNLMKNNVHASGLWKHESSPIDNDRIEYSITFNISVKGLVKQERITGIKYYVK